MTTPFSLFADAVLARPEQIFLSLPAAAKLDYAPGGQQIAYGALAQLVAAQSEAYRQAGYGAGNVVAISLDNRPDFFVHFLALNSLGVGILPLNPDLRSEEVAYQFTIAEPELLVALPAYHRVGGEAGLTSDRVIGPADTVPPARQKAARFEARPEDPCAFLFTSGTTGKPKCCVLSNDYFVRLAQWYVGAGNGGKLLTGEEVILTPLPMFHMNALGCSALGAIILQSTLVPLDRFSASRWWATVAQSGATLIHYLGVMPAILLKLPETEHDRGHKVRIAFGAGVDPLHQETFEHRFGIELTEAWAMTETGGGATTSTAGGDRHLAMRCIGYPHADMDYRIVDDAGADAMEGEPGELVVKAAGDDPRRGFFTEYLKDAVATEEAWTGGWFHTGDVVRRGEDGALYFVDRKKNIVRRSGENIAVVEVEGVLQNLEDIAGVAVAPVPDELRGEEVMALIVLAAESASASGADLARRIARASAERLAYHKVPGYVAFVSSLPTTATQKLQRGEIKKMASAMLSDPKTVDLRDFKGELRRMDIEANRVA